MENEQPEQNTKLDPEAGNPLANSSTQPETPGMTGHSSTGASLPKTAPAAAASPENIDDRPALATPYIDLASNPTIEVPYGGNFGNSTQPVFHDDDRRENQLSGPGRGEFGAQDAGSTQGGYGDQYRADEVYGGKLGTQQTTRGGYAGGKPENNTAPTDAQYSSAPLPDHAEGSTFGTEPGTPRSATTVDSHYQNDNDSPRSGTGFSEDYGRTSLGGGAGSASSTAGANLPPNQRNQTEDYRPSQDGHDSDGLAFRPVATEPRTTELGGRDEPGPAGEPDTADTGSASRTGYVESDGERSQSGDAAEGIGSRGGSYNDVNANKNTGGASAEESSRAEDNQAPVPPRTADNSDYGTMPRRNAGRDNDPERQ
ncbi:hypothetical protein SAMN00120144_3010 [Hymenobacter roseosalivarius DSM 11622]|uniref:Uncharacterized protein n=1 Tax=Hymenobacter roseosalivarius DSM 11622 TaxID=645990 RepID=A0A1W1VTX3_9BACT|nr:hypothetical protein [Hymenobacter roseosalivarius]SMB96809.1 hypothetical protein SAMN00120144_3010 [Hymenobacter roseosalivarius DSM 11622]